MTGYPDIRLRRLRSSKGRRLMLDEPMPGPGKFLWPVFVKASGRMRESIAALPGQYRFTPDGLVKALEKPVSRGLGGILLFGITRDERKDPAGSAACSDRSPVHKAICAVKRAYPGLTVFTDVCLCAYTDSGSCGILRTDGSIDNDATCDRLAEIAVSHAQSGADGVAPSAMMDGQVTAIRRALEANSMHDVILMSYSTKFASSMYGPFRETGGSAPATGDRNNCQTSFRNARLAIRETLLDAEEGADILMVKPALFYLDIIAGIRQLVQLPLAAYNVSGEYAMLWAAAAAGAGDLGEMVRESIAAIRRAGADIIISYWAGMYDEFIGQQGLP